MPCYVSWQHAEKRVFTIGPGHVIMGIALFALSIDHLVESVMDYVYAYNDSAGGLHLSLYCLCLHDKPVQRRQSQHRSALCSRHHQHLYCEPLVLRLLQLQRWSNQRERTRQLTGFRVEAKRNKAIPRQL